MTTVPIAQSPALNVIKSVTSTGPYESVGVVIRYSITVTNTGNQTLTGVTVTDPGVGAVLGSCTPAIPATLAPGASVVCAATHAVTQADLGAGHYTNVATGDSDQTPPSSDDETVVTAAPAPQPTPSNPAISVTKSPKSQTVTSPGTAVWTIAVTNTGNVTLANVRTTDPVAADCAKTSAQVSALASMGPGASVSYTCSLSGITQSLTNVVTATGTPPSGSDVSASDSAQVTVPASPPVLTPAIAITKNPKVQSVLPGGAATWTIVVTNTGQVVLTNVHVLDPQAPGCGRTAARIAQIAPHNSNTFQPGDSVSYTCTRSDVRAPFTNVATVVGTPPTGANVTARDSARVTLLAPPTNPDIQITKSPTVQAILPGATATWMIVVTNSGDVPLRDVHVIASNAPNCNRTKADIAALALMKPGASVTYSCLRANVTAPFTNVVTDIGTAPNGQKVRATDSARVTLLTPPQHPAVQIVKQPKNQFFALKDLGASATAKFEITVTNTGDVTLHAVTVTDQWAPNCNRSLGVLAKGAHRTYTCTRPGVTAKHTNVANVVGTSPSGVKVRDHGNAFVGINYPTG